VGETPQQTNILAFLVPFLRAGKYHEYSTQITLGFK
jgi:hypothetical protein